MKMHYLYTAPQGEQARGWDQETSQLYAAAWSSFVCRQRNYCILKPLGIYQQTGRGLRTCIHEWTLA